MRKTVFVVLMASVLVFAFAATAMAASGVPNRSSAYLPTIANPTTTGAGEVEVAGGGTKAAYVTWGKAKTDMTNAGVAANLRLTPHSDYATTTIKCQVCHSVHKAVYTGENLLMNAGGGCVVCHGATSTVGSTKKVSADGVATDQGGYANEDQRHGKAEACSSYECHATSPHGVGVSSYAVASSALLSDAVDPLIAAALASGSSDTSQTAVLMDDWVTETMHFDKVEIDVYQPALDGDDALAITAPADAAAVARGRAIVTGYTCANNGCHINGSFNGLSADAYFGAYRTFKGGVEVVNSDFNNPDAEGQQNLRDQPIKGHSLFTTADGNQDYLAGDVVTAYAASGTCKSCHDATDVRLGGAKMFPHSNAVWAVADAAGTGNNVSGAFTSYGYVRLYSDAAWFNLAGSASQTPVRTNTRNISATAPTHSGGAQYTVGMDGACLKCHRDGAAGSEIGVGVDY